jgi:hypothetical protein
MKLYPKDKTTISIIQIAKHVITIILKTRCNIEIMNDWIHHILILVQQNIFY